MTSTFPRAFVSLHTDIIKGDVVDTTLWCNHAISVTLHLAHCFFTTADTWSALLIKKPKLEMQHYCSFLTLLQSNMNGHQKWANVYAVQRTSTLLLRVYVLVKYLFWWLSRILLYYLSTFLSPQKPPPLPPSILLKRQEPNKQTRTYTQKCTLGSCPRFCPQTCPNHLRGSTVTSHMKVDKLEVFIHFKWLHWICIRSDEVNWSLNSDRWNQWADVTPYITASQQWYCSLPLADYHK